MDKTQYQQNLRQYRLAIAKELSQLLDGYRDQPAPVADAKIDDLYRSLKQLPARPQGELPYVNLFRWITAKPKQLPLAATPAKALFKMELQSSSQLLEGHLFLLDADGRQLFSGVATSGVAGSQAMSCIWKPGVGPIPPLKGLYISTEAYWCPELKGVNGFWFDIQPWTLRGPNGVTRSAFGVHFDSNVPGSSGCVVLRNATTFEQKFVPLMKDANRQGVESIPLEVKYE
ncbi:MAG TPA: hypothetical protein V6D03_00060 [Candidatus Caenarcaniphilales bacterium]